ncbi:ADP-ribosylglycohydrolase family protein, partial [Bacillus haikouensis]|nr:ADP-ribosylglycohydrolase family protein [Bacillus haikouensis]
KVVIDRMIESDRSKIFYKPFYRRNEFNDEKYKPTFAPTVYSGQKVCLRIFLDQWEGEEITLTPYVRNTFTGEELIQDGISLRNQGWNDLQFIVPHTEGAVIDEVGFIIRTNSPLTNRALGCLYIGEFHVSGQASYEIDFSKQFVEFLSITPFAHHRGEWKLEEKQMRYTSTDHCSSYTGNYYSSDYDVEVNVHPESGESHCLIIRANGIKRQYLVGFDGIGKVSLIRNDFGYTRLKTVAYNWKLGENYLFNVQCEGEYLKFSINGEAILELQDDVYSQGMFGFGCLEKGEGTLTHFKVNET